MAAASRLLLVLAALAALSLAAVACCAAALAGDAGARLGVHAPRVLRAADAAAAAAAAAAADAAADAAARAELGRGAWQLLHRMAASFSAAPSAAASRDMARFFSLLGDFYPCPDCAAHFRATLAARPVDTSNNRALSLWLCAVHNDVNARLAKPLFPCTLDAIKERWGKCGCFDQPNATVDRDAAEAGP
jgi:hypothetical protein